ncbi:MAG TPA: hypothetical protein VK196_00045 [Magnetospirillum sp.]|nr:hypothetical protein [Magnetospirillum sp.]
MTENAAARCPHSSVEMLNRHMRTCRFPKADITVLAKRLQDSQAEPPERPGQDDAAGLKVEKNALALVFIPAVMTLVEEFIAEHPGKGFNLLLGQLGMVDVAAMRAGVDRRNPQASICGHVYMSLRSLFQHIAASYVRAAVAAAEQGDAPAVWMVDNLLDRYQQALSDYHAHTQVSSTHFTPHGHILAGINTALFFILRALSAVVVLGERSLGRPVTRDELATAMRNTAPLLLTIARTHLELLLELEGPLGKQEDLFLSRLDAADYADALARMFVVVNGPEGLRLEIAEDILAGLPVLSGDKPRTGCPALYASTFDNVNAIVALVRLTERAFAELLYG